MFDPQFMNYQSLGNATYEGDYLPSSPRHIITENASVTDVTDSSRCKYCQHIYENRQLGEMQWPVDHWYEL